MSPVTLLTSLTLKLAKKEIRSLLQPVTRMSEAICGTKRYAGQSPGCRFAHPGYPTTADANALR
jgi:hypothetical protein